MTDASDRALRDLLEKTQARNAQLEAQAKTLELRLTELTVEVERLWQERDRRISRLDQADQVRVDWTRRQEVLHHGLRVAQEEQQRLRRVVDNLEAELALLRRGSPPA